MLLADPQRPFGIVGDRRRLVARYVNEGGEKQRLGEGLRVPERLGASYRGTQLLEGTTRVAEHPGDQRQVELALHTGVGTRPIRELHFGIEQIEALPKVRKRRLELSLEVQHHSERHVRPDETGRIVEPFGHTHRLLGEMLRLLQLE